jgi:hypothetical protein
MCMGSRVLCSSTLTSVGLGLGVALLTAGGILSVMLPIAAAPVMTVMGAVAFASSWASISQEIVPYVPAADSSTMWAMVEDIPEASAASPVGPSLIATGEAA